MRRKFDVKTGRFQIYDEPYNSDAGEYCVDSVGYRTNEERILEMLTAGQQLKFLRSPGFLNDSPDVLNRDFDSVDLEGREIAPVFMDKIDAFAAFKQRQVARRRIFQNAMRNVPARPRSGDPKSFDRASYARRSPDSKQKVKSDDADKSAKDG